MVTIELHLHPVSTSLPEPLEDVLVIWNPCDGEPPVLALAYINADEVWHWSMEGEPVQRPECFTHWAHQPVLPDDLVTPAKSSLMKRMETQHVH